MVATTAQTISSHAEAVRQLRAAFNETQQAFSNRLGITVTSVSRYETSTASPAPFVLMTLRRLATERGERDLARFFGTALNEQLGAATLEALPKIIDCLREATKHVSDAQFNSGPLPLKAKINTTKALKFLHEATLMIQEMMSV